MCKNAMKKLGRQLTQVSKNTHIDLVTAKAALNWIKKSIVPNLDNDELKELHEYTFSLNLLVANTRKTYDAISKSTELKEDVSSER